MRAVDLFSGWGGFTEGAAQAGVEVVWAANHWPLAVEAHASNHPGTKHSCQDLQQADWTELPEYDILLSSPACQGHSLAAQGSRKAMDSTRRHHDKLRSTAWAVVDAIEVTHPKAFIVENVPQFKNWNKFNLWVECLKVEGYKIDIRKINASQFNTPQRRTRLFVIGTLDKKVPILKGGDEPGFGPCIDWEREANWSPIDLRPRVLERILRSRERHGERFLTQHTRDHMGVPLSEPIRTITTKDQWAVVEGDRYRPLTVRETARAMGFPDSYSWPKSATRKDKIAGLGNAVCPPVAKALVSAVASVI